ncbi:type IX secretion system sortase PorU [Flavobacterium sp.]|uniref:type IX secretion system sortase PorU n=1 Tax=Flavobacterium sp. TaxID=239 RepID=UPI00261B7542|nr:type IX secretion system sortase PorU [Flavobacterium sp.]
MKKIVYLITLLFSALTFAQQKGEMTINWSEKTSVNMGEEKVTLPQFNPSNFEFDNYNRQLFFNFKIPITQEINENSIQISNIVYESISRAEMGDLSAASTPSTPNITAKNLKSVETLFAFISLSPIIKEGDGFKKIKSFSYSFTSNENRLSSGNNEFNVLSNSVLNTGDWFRFYVVKSGVYILSRSFLSGLGVNVDGLDPRKIKIYGNGGRMIPHRNSVYYPADLAENAIQVVGEDDGVFDGSDYVLFYAEGVDQWNKESETTNNLYDSKSYYYVNVQGNDGKRIQEMSQPSAASDVVLTTFDDYQYHELDKVNIARLGRRWFGEQFDFDDEQDFDFNIPNINTSTPIKAYIYAAAVSSTSTSMDLKANGVSIGNMSFTPVSAALKADFSTLSADIPAVENISINIKYNNNGVPDSKGYLDYIRLKSKRNLIGYGKQFAFQYDLAASSTQIGEFQINNASAIKQVWNVSDIYNVTKVTNNNQSTFSFKTNFGTVAKYVALDPADYYTPATESRTRVANQNLKGTIFLNAQNQFQDIDYLIVCPVFLKNQAEKLANFHRNNSQLNVKVVTLDLIYQEFGSGKQDIGAIRNFVKYVYFNASAPDKHVKYLNLFGDASFDFKNRISIAGNIVPIFHALNSYSVDPSSFASDDYFGLMDDNEGDLDTPGSIGTIDIAVGRMIGNTTAQADELVNKVIDYYDIQSYGSWRNNIVVVADDADRTSDRSLQSNINSMAETIVAQKPFLNYEKILLDSYVQETTAGGARYPKARKDLFNYFEKGALVFNYLGHGGEDGLSQERIWEKSDGQNLSNRYKYPLFITITCEFSRFDNPFRPTAGEYTYWNPKGGAISMITTIREIYQSTGEDFNDVLAKYLFSYGSNEYVSIAEALRLAKNEYNPRTDVVFYLGDPALKLAIPQPRINLTKVNDNPITGPIDDFKSLAYVKLSGDVTDENNNPLPAYNGELSVQIFDKKITRTTLNNDGNSTPINFNVLGETIFRGNATVTNGQFEFGFVVPRDIAIPLDNGRISLYAKRGQTLFDKTGVNTNIKIGGVNLNAAADNIPPKVKLYMNDQTFINGGITNQSPLFLAFLEDENGINTASGIGHDIVAILDGDESNPYKLNDYYETALDNYKSGKVKFPFRNLAKGLHTITFKAWDVYNNLVTSEIQFVVVGDESITITNVLNYPNPFVNYTQFWFTHNKPFEPLEVQVQVLTITGKIVWTKNQTVTTAESTCREITWDGKDDFGDRIGKGVYIYKLTVKSVLTNSKTEKYEKLVIL